MITRVCTDLENEHLTKLFKDAYGINCEIRKSVDLPESGADILLRRIMVYDKPDMDLVEYQTTFELRRDKPFLRTRELVTENLEDGKFISLSYGDEKLNHKFKDNFMEASAYCVAERRIAEKFLGELNGNSN